MRRQSAAWSGQASSREIAKPSYRWEDAKHPIPCGEWRDSVCFEKRARMDSFAAVLPLMGYSSMYETECELMNCADVECYNSEYVCLWLTLWITLRLTLFYICRLKLNYASIGHMRLFLNSASSQTSYFLIRKVFFSIFLDWLQWVFHV